MATSTLCPCCQHDLDQNRWLPPRSPLAQCSCGTVVNRRVALFASAWSFFLFWASFLPLWLVGTVCNFGHSATIEGRVAGGLFVPIFGGMVAAVAGWAIGFVVGCTKRAAL